VCETGERPDKVEPVPHGALLRQLQRAFRFMMHSDLQVPSAEIRDRTMGCGPRSRWDTDPIRRLRMNPRYLGEYMLALAVPAVQ
jgi:hypothetical protein